VSPCASLGELNAGDARRLKSAGLGRYHHNLESCESYFSRVCTTHSWISRVGTVKTAREAGMEICCGGVFGLGESWRHRIELAFTIRGLGVDSVPLNFLVPVKGTAMGSVKPMKAADALRVIALFRYILPGREIKVAGGREYVLGPLQEMIFRAGASGMMVGGYLTTAGRSYKDDLRMIDRLGLEVG
jgi:biotin synthase